MVWHEWCGCLTTPPYVRYREWSTVACLRRRRQAEEDEKLRHFHKCCGNTHSAFPSQRAPDGGKPSAFAEPRRQHSPLPCFRLQDATAEALKRDTLRCHEPHCPSARSQKTEDMVTLLLQPLAFISPSFFAGICGLGDGDWGTGLDISIWSLCLLRLPAAIASHGTGPASCAQREPDESQARPRISDIAAGCF